VSGEVSSFGEEDSDSHRTHTVDKRSLYDSLLQVYMGLGAIIPLAIIDCIPKIVNDPTLLQEERKKGAETNVSLKPKES